MIRFILLFSILIQITAVQSDSSTQATSIASSTSAQISSVSSSMQQPTSSPGNNLATNSTAGTSQSTGGMTSNSMSSMASNSMSGMMSSPASTPMMSSPTSISMASSPASISMMSSPASTPMMSSTMLSGTMTAPGTSGMFGGTGSSNGIASFSSPSVTQMGSSMTMATGTSMRMTSATNMVSSQVPTAGPTSASLGTIGSITTASPINLTLTYQYVITTTVALQTGNITNQTVLNSFQTIVRTSFNLSNFIYRVLRVQVLPLSRATASNQTILADILFTSFASSCGTSCITNSIVGTSQGQTALLPAQDGSLANVTVQSAPTVVTGATTTPAPSPVAVQAGESPPGRAAQLGMGLGISFLAVIIIVEIVVLSRRGSSLNCFGRTRESDYQLSSYG